MQYVSPWSLTGTLETDGFDKKSLSLAKKKMLTELELNGGDSVTINGSEFTKNDIINFFDALQQDNNLHFHIAVAADPVLLRFLEHNLLENGDRFGNNVLYYNQDFVEWVSPYFFTAFTTFGNSCLSSLEEGAWATMFVNPQLMNGYYKEQAWDYFEKELCVDLSRLQTATKKGQNYDEQLIALLCDIRYVNMMRKLPEERFGGFWDHYAFTMMNAAVYVFNKGMRGTADIYIDNARLLAASMELKENIAKKQAEMDFIVNNAPRGNRRDSSNWPTLRVVFFVLIFIIRFATCISSNSTPNFDNVPIYVENRRYDTNQPLDSLIKKIEKLKAGDTLNALTPTFSQGNHDTAATKPPLQKY